MLLKRILTVAVLLPLFVGGLFYLPGDWWAIALLPMVMAGAWEWANLAGFKPVFRGLYVLLLLVQLASFITIRSSIAANARVQIAAELRTGESVLRRLLAQNEQQLTEAARLGVSEGRAVAWPVQYLPGRDQLVRLLERERAAGGAAAADRARPAGVHGTARQPGPTPDLRWETRIPSRAVAW